MNYPTIDVLKKHYPSCSKIFDQIKETKDDEDRYRSMRESMSQTKSQNKENQ